jgi:ferredoxin-NADP reductase
MKNYIVKILKKDFVTHDVKSFIFEKPKGYKFIPGQATDASINTKEFKEKKNPFTFASKNSDLVLEFIMKRYDGITSNFHELNPGEEIIISEPFGSINYKGEGVFIAGGSGITPFLAIFRSLNNGVGKSKLIFSNKTRKDIISELELAEMFGENVKFLVTDENADGYLNEKIDRNFLKREIKNFNQYFYICGPPAFVSDIKGDLIKLGAKEEKIIVEKS